jgi:integrase
LKAVRGERYIYRRGDRLYFRRGVPDDVRGLFGGRAEVQVSLRTSSIAEARHKRQRELDKFEQAIAAYRGEVAPSEIAHAPSRPSVRVLEAGVREAFAERMERVQSVNRADPDAVHAALRRLEDLKFFLRETMASRRLGSDGPTLDVVWMAEALCERNRWAVEEGSDTWWKLIDLVTRAQIEATERQLQGLEGRPQQTSDEMFSAEHFIADAQMREQSKAVEPVSLLTLFDEYVAERKPAPATIKAFGRQVRRFSEFLQHDDARRVSKQDVDRWKVELLARGGKDGSPLNPRTVRETYLPAIRVALQRGVDSGMLTENVAKGVGVLGKKKTARLRSPSLSDDEALKILRATLIEGKTRLSPERKLARRWVPWLCAYTGARVNEITQLRAEDVSQKAGIWTIRITPEAGSTKNHEARVVALHPHLLDQGFHKIVRGKSGPLFFDPRMGRGGSEQNPLWKNVGEFIARWVREDVGVDDRLVQPSHGWRHRFKSQARICRMDPEIRDYIQGHAPRTEGEAYGDISPEVTFREIKRLPRYVID